MISKLIIILFILLIGYSIGRRIGLKEGYTKGINEAPINIRKEILKSGLCPFCRKNN